MQLLENNTTFFNNTKHPDEIFPWAFLHRKSLGVFFVLSSAWLLAFRSTSQLGSWIPPHGFQRFSDPENCQKPGLGISVARKHGVPPQKKNKKRHFETLPWLEEKMTSSKNQLDMVLKNEMLETLERRKKVGIHTNNGGKMFTQNLTLILLEFLLQKKLSNESWKLPPI